MKNKSKKESIESYYKTLGLEIGNNIKFKFSDEYSKFIVENKYKTSKIAEFIDKEKFILEDTMIIDMSNKIILFEKI